MGETDNDDPAVEGMPEIGGAHPGAAVLPRVKNMPEAGQGTCGGRRASSGNPLPPSPVRPTWVRAFRAELLHMRRNAIEKLREAQALPPRARRPLFLTDDVFEATAEAHLLGCKVWPPDERDDLQHVRVRVGGMDRATRTARAREVGNWVKNNPLRGRYYLDTRMLYRDLLIERPGGIVGARAEYWLAEYWLRPSFIPLFLEDDEDMALARLRWE